MNIADWAKSFKSVWGVGVLIATAGPLGLLVPDMYPPWPDHSYLIGVIFCAISAIVSFTVGVGYAHQPGASSKVQTAIALACLVLGLTSLISYFLIYSTRVVVETQVIGAEQHLLRFVVGTEMRADMDKSTDGDNLELLRDNQYSPERIWTPESLRYSRFLLLITFVTAFSMLTVGMGLLATRSGSSRRPAPHNVSVQS
jgi:hypothetical protein